MPYEDMKNKTGGGAISQKADFCPVKHRAYEPAPLRPELTRLPPRIASLPVDKRGYPIPWFVALLPDGQPEFRAMDTRKWKAAVDFRRCWTCGGPLGVHMVFVAGPMCGINRVSAEPPSHLDCAEWSATNCPFLNQRQIKRREDETINNESLAEDAPGFALPRQPGVAMLWGTKKYTVFPDQENRPLIRMGDPERIVWYSHGRPASRAEVEQSVATGIHSLEEAAGQQYSRLTARLENVSERTRAENLASIAAQRAALEKWYPNA